MMKRLFIAIPVAEEVKIKLKTLLWELQDTNADLKLVSLQNIHFTLKFLGKVAGERIPEIVEKLTTLQQKPFSISLSGVGVFPSLERIKVLWVGINSPELLSLVKKINQSLNYIRPEEHEEKPHLTIARIKSGRNKENLKELVRKYQPASFGEMMAEKMFLYESELGKAEPKYTQIKEFTFKG